MPDTLRLAGALLAPHSHQESDLLDGDLYGRLGASEAVTGLWGFPAAGISIGDEGLSSPSAGVLAVGGDLQVGGSISLDGTVDGVDVSDHAALHERNGSQVVRAARLHSGADADKPSSGNDEGDVWWAGDTDKLYVWDGAAWKEIGAAGGGGGVTVEESDTEVVAAASVLDFGAGFDVTEGPSEEANIALDLTEAVWTFGQGGFRFRDGSGPLVYTGASGDELFLTGDLDISGVAAIGSLASLDPGGRQALRILHQTGDVGVTQAARGLGLYARLTIDTSTTGFAYGVGGEVEYQGTSGSGYALGMMFNAIQNGGDLAWLHGIYVTLISYAGAGTMGEAKGLWLVPNFSGYKPGTFWGIHVGGHADMQTAYGLEIEDFTGTTIRLLELGPSTPYLRVVGGADPGANQTNLYLKESTSLRRVQWKAGNTLGAGDKVMVLV